MVKDEGGGGIFLDHPCNLNGLHKRQG
jgi:hypothetical protein